MLSTLEKFDKVTAAGILARAAIAADDEVNPAAAIRLPDENSIRSAVWDELRRELGIRSDDDSPSTVERVVDAIDAEIEKLIEAPDTDAALQKLSARGELPSDLYDVMVSPSIQEFHGDKFFREYSLIAETVHDPDQEQHFGIPKDDNGPALVSLFAKHYPNENRLRSFTLLVAGQRDGLRLAVHQAWRLYFDRVDMVGIKDLVDMLRRFANAFGVDFLLNGKPTRFALMAEIKQGERFNALLNVNHKTKIDGRGRVRIEQRKIEFTWFHQDRPNSKSAAALAVAIDMDKYRSALKDRGY